MPTRRSTTLAVVAAGAAALIGLTGCSTSSSAEHSSGPVTIDFWHAMAGPAATELDKLVADFNEENKDGVTVKATFQGTYADIQTKYTAAVQSGSTPDLLMMNDVSTGFMVDSGQTVAASTFTKDDADFHTDDVVPAAKNYYSGKDGLAAVPFSVSTPVLYLNKEIVAKAGLDATEPPTTLDEVAEWAEKIHDTTGTYGMSMNMADSWMLEELSAAGGKAFCTPDNGRDGTAVDGVSLTSPTQVQFMTTLQKLYQDGSALNPGTDSAAQNSAFTSGKVGMVLTSSGAYTTIDPDGQHSVVATFPTTASSKDAGQVIGGNALWISGKGHSDAEQKASYEFAKYLTTPDVQAEWAKATGYLAMNTGSADTATGKAALEDPNVATMYRQLQDDPASTATAGCVTGAFPTIRATVIGAFNKVVEGADVESTMQAAEQQAKSQIADYNQAAGK